MTQPNKVKEYLKLSIAELMEHREQLSIELFDNKNTIERYKEEIHNLEREQEELNDKYNLNQQLIDQAVKLYTDSKDYLPEGDM